MFFSFNGLSGRTDKVCKRGGAKMSWGDRVRGVCGPTGAAMQDSMLGVLDERHDHQVELAVAMDRCVHTPSHHINGEQIQLMKVWMGSLSRVVYMLRCVWCASPTHELLVPLTDGTGPCGGYRTVGL